MIRIDPDINIDTLSGIGPIERPVYKAIQKYGMYCRDTNDAGLGISVIGTISLPDNAYPEGFDTDNKLGNYYLKNFPFEYLQVIYTGDLQTSSPHPFVDQPCAVWK